MPTQAGPLTVSSASPAELAAQRAVTTAFIAANPTILELIPRSPIKDGNGVRWVDLPTRPAQTVRLVDEGAISASSGGTVAGIQRQVQYQLLLEWNGEVGLHDYWVDEDGIRCEVTSTLTYNGYEMRAEITRLGESGSD